LSPELDLRWLMKWRHHDQIVALVLS
jgi:hypothetical protein